MGKGIVKLGEGQWAVKDGNLLAAKETNGRFKNTEFTVSRGTRASYVGRDGLIKESNLQDVNLVNNGDFSELGSEIADDNTITNSNGGIITKTSDLNYNVISDGTTATQFLPRITFDGLTSGKTYKLIITPSNQSGDIDLKLYNGSSFLFQDNDMSSELVYYFTSGVNNSFIAWAGQQTFNVDFAISLKEVDPNDYWNLGTGWSIEDGVATSDGVSGNSNLVQENILTVGKTYKVSVDVTRNSGEVRFYITSDPTATITSSGTYTFYGVCDRTDLDLHIKSVYFDGTIDNISIQEVKTDTPRIDFTDNTDGHLLLEPQSTNLVTHSEDFTNSSWTPTPSLVSVASNQYISPNGSQNADRLQIQSTSSLAILSYLVAHTINVKITVSAWVKSNTDSVEKIKLFGDYGTANAISNEFLVTDTWKRIEFTFVPTATGNRNVGFYNVSNLSTDIQIYGFQAEALSHSTSYIPTNGSTVTRDAETCTGAGSSADFNSEEGVLYAEISALAELNQGIAISDGGYDNRILFYFDTSGNIRGYIFASGNEFSEITSGIDYKSLTKMAIKYSATSTKFYVNGNLIGAEDTSSTMPSGLNQLNLNDGGGGNKFYGKVKAIKVYKELLSDTDLQNLTS